MFFFSQACSRKFFNFDFKLFGFDCIFYFCRGRRSVQFKVAPIIVQAATIGSSVVGATITDNESKRSLEGRIDRVKTSLF